MGTLFETCNFENAYVDYLADLYSCEENKEKEFSRMASKTTVFVRGKVYWPKILGAPRPNYEGTGREWAYELEPYDTSFLKEHKLLDRLKNKYDDRGPYLNLRKPEKNFEGNVNEPIRVYDENNESWDSNKLIGNGSEVDAKLIIMDHGPGKKKSIYTAALRVRELVPYISSEFGAMDGDTPPKQKAKTKVADLDLDDDIPF